MGWTSVHVNRRCGQVEALALYSPYFKGSTWKGGSAGVITYVIESIAKGPGAVYAVLAKTDTMTGVTVRMALIILTQFSKGEFAWKALSETDSPNPAAIPLSMYRKLSDPVDFATGSSLEHSQDWRKRVEDYHASKKGQAAIQVGDELQFKEEVRFKVNGVRVGVRRFLVQEWGRRKRLMAQPDLAQPFLCRLSGRLLRTREFIVLRQGALIKVFNQP